MILLDTHVALWLLHDPGRIGPSARRALESAATVYFSPISLVETSVKRMIGRIDVPDDLDRIFVEQGLVALPLTPEHAVGVERFTSLARHDPFDRVLLAQAAVERCQLATADRRLLDLDLDWVIDARS
ncbi:hypothetical protein N802_05095 [Knoellia sinensis KCTC 19936]|uniref:PIN domain-containing protein n=1 Tax=Knoellia sinensis KCTC 19936 TaxID=1385520 RepID=A0A0A0J5X0_9MICO|nr:type II toxin-antitoxin system VapC family toxin [Knoellia sinensis]KGN30981.1 hypothetical protein N802_05095 [Knoellia sinensis KCTC 19936]